MANIARRSNGQWRARYRDLAGKEHARHFGRKVDAQLWLDTVTTAVHTGSYVDPTRMRLTLGEWSGQWLATKVDLKPTTRRGYEWALRVHILPTWGPVRLGDITHQGIAAWVAGLTESGLGASSVRQAHRVLSLVLALGVRDGRLARNPAVGVPLPRALRGEQVFLTHEQVDQLAEASGRNRLAILFLAYTGVRYGEMAALRVRQPRPDAAPCADRRGRRRRQRARGVGHAEDPPAAARCPSRAFSPTSSLCTSRARHRDDFVFAAEKGGVLHLRNFRRTSFDPAVRAVGLDGLTPHALRHTAASLAIASGANVKVVQTMLGHKSATMTLDLYGHLLADQLDEVADAMDAARAAGSAAGRPERSVAPLVGGRSLAGPVR